MSVEELSERVPQITDDVFLVLTLPVETDDWAEDLLRGDEGTYGAADRIERTSLGLVLTRRIGGNCNAIANARSWLAEVEDVLDEGDIDPMGFTLVATSSPEKSDT